MSSPTVIIPTGNKVSASSAKLISVIIILLLCAISAFALRIVSIHRLGRKWKAHDYSCAFSLFAFTGYCIDLIVGITVGGFGLPVTEVSPSHLVIAFKVFFGGQFFWSASVTFFRFAIVLLYIEIFVRPVFFWTAAATATIVITYYVACVITILSECHPINFNWDRSIDGTCANTKDVEIFSAAWNMALDIWVVCMPLPILWNLNMATKRKLAISTTFALSLVIAGLNLGRLFQNLICDQTNFTHCAFQSSMIVIGEMSMGIIVACVPTFGPVFFPKRAQKHTSYQHSNERSRVFGSKRPLGGSGTTSSGEGTFHSLDDDEIELNRALQIRDGARVSRGSGNEYSEEDFGPNAIHVKKDLTVVGTSKATDGYDL